MNSLLVRSSLVAALSLNLGLGTPAFALNPGTSNNPKSARTSKLAMPADLNGPKPVVAPAVSSRPLKVAVFSGDGAPDSSVDAVVRAVSYIPNATSTVLKGPEVGTTDLKQFDVIAFPGGSGSSQSKSIGDAGLNNVREFVRGGGGYVGICAGAYLACSNFKWSLGILNASTVSSKWRRGLGVVEAEVTDSGKTLLGNVEGRFKVRYNNGPIIKPGDRTDIAPYTPLAYFRTEMAENDTPVGVMVNSPSQASGSFGKGRVFISSPHPEGTPGLENLIPRAIVWASGQDASATAAAAAR